MLKRNYILDKKEIQQRIAFFIKDKIKFNLVMYPEGTRISEEKIRLSQEYCRKNGKQVLHNLLFPKVKGFVLMCQEMEGKVESVVDVSVYFEGDGVVSLGEFLFNVKGGNVKVRVERFMLDEIGDYEKFLVQRFVEKDKLIQKWKKESEKSKLM